MILEAEIFNQLDAIRKNCQNIFELCLENQLDNFHYQPEKLDNLLAYVINEIKFNYPDLKVPFHSRWRHLPVMPNDLKSSVELVIISVLMDAGAGMEWKYKEQNGGNIYSKSEGLAMASYDMYTKGFFSNSNQPIVEISRLSKITDLEFASALQVSESNKLTGLSGRLKMIQQFIEKLEIDRLGDLVEQWVTVENKKTVSVKNIFSDLVKLKSNDIWQHTKNISKSNPEGLIPFHKLIQWLCYSLIEPLQNNGIQVIDIDSLTGLPEYRNGGLLIDFEVLVPKERNAFSRRYLISDEFIVEWRALTVILLDIIAVKINSHLKTSLPLASILQGGTWSAGRKIAAEKRNDHGSPVAIISDGTVF